MRIPRRLTAAVFGAAALLVVSAPAVVDESALPLQPVRLVIPSIDVDSSMEQLEVSDRGHLPSPVDAERTGWFNDSPVPGELGSAVIVGHLDAWNGPGVFWRLGELRPGARMIVTRSDGVTQTFEVAEIRRVRREDFPTEDVYGAIPDRALRLITCGGVYDRARGGYVENVLVLALAV